MLSKNIRVYVEILPSFAVEVGNDILQHPVISNLLRFKKTLISVLVGSSIGHDMKVNKKITSDLCL